MLIIAGELHVDPADRDRYLEATAKVAVLARAYPGCLDFVQAPDPLVPGRINVYERWTDDDSLHAFRNSGPESDTAEAPQMIKADVKKYRISGIEEP